MNRLARRLLVMALSACASLALATGAAQAQPRDTRPIRIVVIVAPGGSADLVARLLAEKLSTVTGRTYIVDNKPGAGGNLATELVAQAAADGTTLLITTNNHTINPAIYPKIGYDPLTDFAPVMLVGRGPSVIAVHPTVKANTLQELLALARSDPGALSYGSGGIGNPGNIQGELLKSLAHIDMVHVAYRGAGPAMNDAVAGQIPVVFGSLASALPFMKTGRLRVLGVTSANRTPLAPELPTIAEAGVPGYAYDLWWGILAPRKTPVAIVQQQNADLARVMAMPDVREKLLANGVEPVGGSTAEFEQMLKIDLEASYRLAKAANIKAE